MAFYLYVDDAVMLRGKISDPRRHLKKTNTLISNNKLAYVLTLITGETCTTNLLEQGNATISGPSVLWI